MTDLADSILVVPEHDEVSRLPWDDAERSQDRSARRTGRLRTLAVGVGLLLVLALAVGVRVWHINDVGYNSDEAVYAGQGKSIAHDPVLSQYFPVFRAHPLLFQSVVSIGYQFGGGDLWGRLAAAGFGIATILLVFETGRVFYGRIAGLVAALLMAVMPYHVVVTRQVLLDGPQTFFTTLTLYLLARYARTQRPYFLYAAGAGLGLSVLAKEPSILFAGTVYAFLALAPDIGVRLRDLLIAGAVTAITILPYPLSIAFSGRSKTGGNFLAWQLFRRPNHTYGFYPETVPFAIGILVVAVAVAGLILRRRRRAWTWRETLLLSWVLVPAAFFELWPVKGFQYLLPTAPAVAILCAGAITSASWRLPRQLLGDRIGRHTLAIGTLVVVFASLALPTWGKVQPSQASTFLAGSGGVPGGRTAGHWIDAHVPKGATLLAIGPSMANILMYYGHRQAYGLSISSNPLHRNPAYLPVENPDRQIRSSNIQYLVWDAFSANRTPFFTRTLMRYVSIYNGRVLYTATVRARDASGHLVNVPVIRIYEVRAQ